MKVVVSNGFNKFHLAAAASELSRRGILCYFVTGCYPDRVCCRLLSKVALKRLPPLQRFLARAEDIDETKIVALWLPEMIYFLRVPIGRRLKHAGQALNRLSFWLYGLLARRAVLRAAAQGATIYHYRAGFGGASVACARRAGMLVLCDHSIAHPCALAALLTSERGDVAELQGLVLEPVEEDILRDIHRADAILVNSRFVQGTFHDQCDTDIPIYVIHQGLDSQFASYIPQFDRDEKLQSLHDPVRLLFAGSFQHRKGARVLVEALTLLADIPWKLTIAGSVEPSAAAEHASFLADQRVSVAGVVSRRELAQLMSNHAVFLFPSLAEGSARVVFEALACGCYAITTANAGSIVEHGIHGALTSPGDSDDLAAAIRTAIEHPSRTIEICSRNYALLSHFYTQEDYGSKLVALYSALLNAKFGEMNNGPGDRFRNS